MRASLTDECRAVHRADTVNSKSMQILQWDMVIESDTSMLDWGVSLNTSMGGLWVPQERSHHINFFELLATFLAFKTFATNTQPGSSPEIRQRDSDGLPQQNGGGGGHIQIYFAILERNIHPCRIPPQEAECQNRLALTTHTGMQRLAATLSDLQTT